MESRKIGGIPSNYWRVVAADEEKVVIQIAQAISRDNSQRDESGEIQLARSSNVGNNMHVEGCLTSGDTVKKVVVVQWYSVSPSGPFEGRGDARFVYPRATASSLCFWLVPEKVWLAQKTVVANSIDRTRISSNNPSPTNLRQVSRSSITTPSKMQQPQQVTPSPLIGKQSTAQGEPNKSTVSSATQPSLNQVILQNEETSHRSDITRPNNALVIEDMTLEVATIVERETPSPLEAKAPLQNETKPRGRPPRGPIKPKIVAPDAVQRRSSRSLESTRREGLRERSKATCPSGEFKSCLSNVSSKLPRRKLPLRDAKKTKVSKGKNNRAEESNKRMAFEKQFLAMLSHLKIPHETDDWLTLSSPSNVATTSREDGGGTIQYGLRSHAYVASRSVVSSSSAGGEGIRSPWGLRICCTREMPSATQVAALEKCARRGLDFLLLFDPGWASGKPLSSNSAMVGIRWSPKPENADISSNGSGFDCRLSTWKFGNKSLIETTN